MIERPMTAVDYARQRRAEERTSEFKQMFFTPRVRPADPAVIVFADGCASWLTYRQREWAERALIPLKENGPARWDGATVVPTTVVRLDVVGRRRLRFNADTGLLLRSWLDCAEHRTDLPDVGHTFGDAA